MAKRNKMLRKVLVTMCSAVLLVGATVGVTVAYLTSTTNEVNNTFSVGNVSFDQNGALDEVKVDEYGKAAEDAERVTANKYKLIPGHEYTKDPTVHIADNSEDCWLFVKVDNGIAAIEADTTIAAQMTTLGWTPVAEGSNIYAYKETVQAGEDVVVFETFTLKDDANVADYADASIDIQAYAVQADGFDTSAAAWTAAPLTDWTTTTTE